MKKPYVEYEQASAILFGNYVIIREKWSYRKFILLRNYRNYQQLDRQK